MPSQAGSLRYLMLLGVACAGGLGSELSLKVPAGFSVSRVAGPPELQFPMFACLDDTGNLFVAESSGLDLYQELQKQTRRCRIRRLSNRDGDGKFKGAKIFADQLVFPMGLAWRDGKLYAADPPDLITLDDTDGDGRSDKRTVILTGFGHQDNGSLHGLTFGPDGWLYMTMGSPDGYHLKRDNGSLLIGSSGALLRCRPDGSGIEVVSRGFENLVEIVFMPAGEIIGTDNWFSWPRDGLRDALVHLVEGGLYPMGLKDRGTVHLVSGDPLPPIAMYPAVAVSGLMRHRGKSVPAEFAGCLFSAQHNSRKIVRHKLERDGSTFRSAEADFLTTDDPDFHPSDVLEDTDGSILVVDTGSWYIHHCPTGAIRRTAAKGGIYRVRFSNASATEQPNSGLDGASSQPFEGLVAQLAANDPEAVALAARILGRRGEKNAGGALAELLGHAVMHVRLAAAEALAHCGGTSSVTPLITALTAPADRLLEHAIIHALHRIAGRDQLLDMLSHSHPRVQKVSMILLDQPPHDSLPAEAVATRLYAEDESLQRTALSILERHADWASHALSVVRRLSTRTQLSEREQMALRKLVIAFHSNPEIQATVADIIEGTGKQDVRLLAIAALNDAKIETLPASWTGALKRALREASPPVQLAALHTLKARRAADLEHDFMALARTKNIAEEVRAEAAHALLRLRPRPLQPEFDFMLRRLDRTQNPMTRLAAAEALSTAELGGDQFEALLKSISGDPVIAPATALGIAQRATLDADRINALLDYVARSVQAGWQLSQQQLTWLKSAGANPSQVEAIEKELARNQTARGMQLAKLEELLSGGEPQRGQNVFSGKGACAGCHRVGAQGSFLGPDLTKIGAIRAGRDLVEALLFPSASFAQGYETWHVVLKSGEELAGLRVRQPDDTFVLRAVGGTEYRLPADQIQSVEQMKFSLMPEGLLSAFTSDEIRDLLAYLQSLR
ncbi:MAG: DUF7133 domain-containing protein [Verrucomicrobiales bacterium]